MKKAPKPKKAVKEPLKAIELGVKAISPSERESREEIDFYIRHIADGELNVEVVANLKDHTEASGILLGQLSLR
jgi:5,10-methenyltetrahydromethanopterin hydrogenase